MPEVDWEVELAVVIGRHPDGAPCKDVAREDARAHVAGYTVAKEGGRPVIVQISGDVKYGFNDKIQLAMSVWLSVPDSLRDEYVGVVVEP